MRTQQNKTLSNRKMKPTRRSVWRGGNKEGLGLGYEERFLGRLPEHYPVQSVMIDWLDDGEINIIKIVSSAMTIVTAGRKPTANNSAKLPKVCPLLEEYVHWT